MKFIYVLWSLVIYFAISLSSADIKVGDKVDFASIQTQFGKQLNISSSIKKVIIALDKKEAETFVGYMDKHPNYLKLKKAVYIAYIGKAPSFIKFLFIKPKLRRYSFDVGIIEEDLEKYNIPVQEGKLTIFDIDNLKVKKIIFKKEIS
jgi:hypothetical protein